MKEKSRFAQFMEQVLSLYPAADYSRIVELCKLSKSLGALNEKNGMRSLTDREIGRKEQLREQAAVIVAEVLPGTGVEFNSDWRGTAIKLRFTNGRFNCMDGTWSVPTAAK